jgi:hypothetical protein
LHLLLRGVEEDVATVPVTMHARGVDRAQPAFTPPAIPQDCQVLLLQHVRQRAIGAGNWTSTRCRAMRIRKRSAGQQALDPKVSMRG